MSHRVLIIEDEPAQRRILEEMVKRFGFEVMTAENGQRALEILSGSQGSTINLAVLDLMMPVMNGWEFLERRRKDDILVTIPVVLVTAVDDTGIGAVPKVAGIIKKPVNLELLLESVQRYCRRAEAA